jgi:hypothetical protein
VAKEAVSGQKVGGLHQLQDFGIGLRDGKFKGSIRNKFNLIYFILLVSNSI